MNNLLYIPVSVVIPCYICINTIERAIASVNNQENLPNEIILVDDASPDNGITLQHLYWIQKQYQNRLNIKVIARTKNGGPGAARNIGWSHATQLYVAFLDADDTWHPSKLRLQFEYMKNNPDVSLSGHVCPYLRNKETAENMPLVDINCRQISRTMLLFKNFFSTPSVMLRREIPLRFTEGRRFSEDWLLWQRMALAGMVLMYIDKPLAYVHKPLYGAGGLSAQLWQMEIGELNNFLTHYHAKNISFVTLMAAASISFLKYVKRFLLYWLTNAGITNSKQ